MTRILVALLLLAPVQEQPVLVAGRWTVTIIADAARRFYRLHSSP